jgi:DNA-binding NarL/FixJ family response regulator
MERKELNYDEFKNLDFNKSEYEYFLENCNFTDRQLEIFNLRRKGLTYIQMSFELHLSESTLKREVKRIKNKILKII